MRSGNIAGVDSDDARGRAVPHSTEGSLWAAEDDLAGPSNHNPRRFAGRNPSANAALGLAGTPWDKGIRTAIPAKDGIRAGDRLNRYFTAPWPNHTWLMDFKYCRTWNGSV